MQACFFLKACRNPLSEIVFDLILALRCFSLNLLCSHLLVRLTAGPRDTSPRVWMLRRFLSYLEPSVFSHQVGI